MTGFFRAGGNTLQAGNTNAFIGFLVIALRDGMDRAFLITQSATVTAFARFGCYRDRCIFSVRLTARDIYGGKWLL